MRKLMKIMTILLFLVIISIAVIGDNWFGTVTINNTLASNTTIIEAFDFSNGASVSIATYPETNLPPYASIAYYSAVDPNFLGRIYFKVGGFPVDQDEQMTSVSNGISCSLCSATTHWFNISVTDADGDGYAAGFANYTGIDKDCDDTNALINPGMTETTYNGINDDCNVSTKDNDLDNDTYCKVGTTIGIASECTSDIGIGTDCDDNNLTIFKEMTLWADFDLDNYTVSNNVTFCTDGIIPTNYSNVSSNLTDCNDLNSLENPGLVEITYNGLNDDCNLATLDDDLDGDSYFIANDCNDANAQIFPNAPDRGCGTDWDCKDGAVRCSSGGGGGGSSCARNYTCTDWTDCTEAGSQTRTCTDQNRCVTNPREETQSCTYTPPVVTPPVETPTEPTTPVVNSGSSSTNNSASAGTNVEQGTNTTTQTGSGSGNQLTGQVIGGQGFKPTWWMSLLAIILIAGGIIGAFFYFRGRNDVTIIK